MKIHSGPKYLVKQNALLGAVSFRVSAICRYLVWLGLPSQGLFVLVTAHSLFLIQFHGFACLKQSLVLVHGPGRSFPRDRHSNHTT